MKRFVSVIMLFVMIFLLTGCGKADSYFNNGKKNFLNGKYEEAAEDFAEAINKNPNRADYYIAYGMALIGLSQYEEALSQFDHVIMDKNIRMVLKNNKRALRGKGIAYYKMQDYEEAISQFDKALDLKVLSELDTDILYYKGNALLNLENYEEAAKTFTEIIERTGEDAQVLAARAYTYQNLGEYDKSLEDYDRAIALKNDKYDFYFGKYYLLKKMNRETEADELLKTAEQIEVKTPADKYNMAKIHFYEGLYDQAIAELEESASNGFIEAYFYTGEIFSRKKDYPTAKYYYEKYMEEGGAPSPAVYNQIASCLIKTGDYEQAASYLENGILYSYGEVKRVLLKNLIVAYENLGDFESALETMENYLALCPGDEDAKSEEVFLKSRMPNAGNEINNQ